MKANHITRTQRLQNRINKLVNKMQSMWVKYGKANPYQHCKYCGKSQIECSVYGHRKGCEVAGIEKEIEHYASLINE